MSEHLPDLEIHVHGDVLIRTDVNTEQVQEALKPLWTYQGAKLFNKGKLSHYEDEPGIVFNAENHELHLCWTLTGNEDFRQCMEEACMSLNELAEEGASLEVSFYDVEFNEGEEEEQSLHDFAESRDDFIMYFVGPTPASIMQVQRDLLVQDSITLMERHFDTTELGGIVAEIDRLFTQRFDQLVNSLELDRLPRSSASAAGGSRGNNRKPRHLH